MDVNDSDDEEVAENAEENQYQSENESEDEEVEEEEVFESIETNDNREFCKKDNFIFEPENLDKPFAEFIQVDDENAPFNIEDGEYHIAGNSITRDDKEYYICELTNVVYDKNTREKVGIAMKTKKGKIKSIKKC